MLYVSISFLIVFFALYFYFVFSKKNSSVIRWALLLGVLVMGYFPLLAMFGLTKKMNVNYFYILNFVMINGVILFLLVLLSKIVLIKKPIGNKIALSLLFLSIFATGHSFYEGLKVPPIKNIDIKTDKVKQDYKIIFLSDIHLSRSVSVEKIKKLVERVNDENADAIILGGDIIDDEFNNIKPHLEELEKLSAKQGVHFVTGNHEVYKGLLYTILQMKSMNFKYMLNNGTDLGDVFIAGIPDIKTQRRTVYIEGAFDDADKSDYKILTTHTPHNFKEKNNFDLMLSGHTHGGQVFPFHILAKNHNKYLAGFYDLDNDSQIYVSRGAGQWGPQIRFLAPSEITVLNIKPN
ncbi:MAG: metallophosphoesterase [Alphaproteobacteria bacterium]